MTQEELDKIIEQHQHWIHECVYGWRVITPIKFDTPKTLEEFDLKRPPQSWCYTEVDV